MIDRATLVDDLRRLLVALEDDLRERCDQHPEVDRPLRRAWEAAKEAGRTAEGYEAFREGELTQAAAAWILTTVFVRFLEDQGLVPEARLAGPGEALRHAKERRTAWFRQRPEATDRDYLLEVFREIAALPAMKELLDERHNPLFRVGLSADGATKLLAFWQEVDAGTGELRRDFRDPEQDTRFLGDLYQDLSEAARKRYALLQTPLFVEEFILDRTLEPAIAEFGFRAVRLIDPTCGSGHFLLGAFQRLFRRWMDAEPRSNPRDLAQRALDQVAGVDVNPFAVAIARFRLLLAALRACELRRLKDAPGFRLHLATGDSLLHGARRDELQGGRQRDLLDEDPLQHVYETEDAEALKEILAPGRYHVVVGNPPYITPKDKALNEAYRRNFGSCHMKYSLGVPFTERFFDLALRGEGHEPAGYVGLITANSFMKREFGKKLIEQYFPGWDLTHVIDTSGAYIPGHGTPTVILFARHRKPAHPAIRAVMGIRGEPTTPDDPARGLVWTSILTLVDRPGSQSDFVSVSDVPRPTFEKHPWSIGGGGAAELKERIEEAAAHRLVDTTSVIGVFGMTNADDVMIADAASFARYGVERDCYRPLVVGDAVRDWTIATDENVVFPYANEDLVDLRTKPGLHRWLWPCRTVMGNRATFARLTYFEEGRPWFEWHQVALARIRTPRSITFAEVATHNHFVLDRGGKVFNRTAPVIKLKADATEDDHLALLGLLNSSTACFWLKQVCHNKGKGGGSRVEAGSSPLGEDNWENHFAFNGARLEQTPLPQVLDDSCGRRLDALARDLAACLPATVVRGGLSNRAPLDAARKRAGEIRGRMIALQEELDWECYRAYGIVEEGILAEGEVPEVRVGERAFEIVLGRKMAAGEVETQWFARHGATPITEVPERWPEGYRKLVLRRIEEIGRNPDVALIERPEYKRRWNAEAWEDAEAAALRGFLLDRLESGGYWPEAEVQSAARLADRAREDREFMQVAELYRGRPDFDVAKLVLELVQDESVPFLPILRYKPSGLRKRKAWEETWELQRKEDAALAHGPIPVPPKYTSADFLSQTFWRLRGKLDVPKERFLSFPHAERPSDPSLPLLWAGFDHAAQAQALAAYYFRLKDESAPPSRQLSILSSLHHLLPWLLQYHPTPAPGFDTPLPTSISHLLSSESPLLSLSPKDLPSWSPPTTSSRRRSS